MRFILGHFFRRLPREGIKSLTIPLLTFVLAVLINLLGAVKAWMEAEYEDTMDNFAIIAELSDLTGDATDGLNIGKRYFNLFLDPEEPLSLHRFTGELTLKRRLDIVSVSGQPVRGMMTGITNIGADDALGPETGTVIAFFEGYDESVFGTEDLVCVVSADLLGFAEDGVLNVTVLSRMRHVPRYRVSAGLTVIGTVSGADNGVVYGPFWTVSNFGSRSDRNPPYTDRLSMTVANNRVLSRFKQMATLSFSRVRPIYDPRPFAMMVYDSEFYETIEPLWQNIILIDIATPFVYAISVCVGFVASILLTRRRKPEFAVMRSVGVHKRDIFFGALAEQAALSAAGAALGCALIAAAWGYLSLTRPAVFLACFLLGAVISSIKAAGTDVLKILRDKE
jgi:hypothetical protein